MSDKKEKAIDPKTLYNVKRKSDGYTQQMTLDQLNQKKKKKTFDKDFEELGKVKKQTKAEAEADANALLDTKIKDAKDGIAEAKANHKSLKDAKADKEDILIAKQAIETAEAVLEELK